MAEIKEAAEGGQPSQTIQKATEILTMLFPGDPFEPASLPEKVLKVEKDILTLIQTQIRSPYAGKIPENKETKESAEIKFISETEAMRQYSTPRSQAETELDQAIRSLSTGPNDLKAHA